MYLIFCVSHPGRAQAEQYQAEQYQAEQYQAEQYEVTDKVNEQLSSLSHPVYKPQNFVQAVCREVAAPQMDYG